ncbi:hypothetical protein Pan216_39610 [Planctomycetes bacterium Pan216]|uniref:Uncharacterized protein n=1 Tax=Kolteria novifilia TaxID=2527975 RepID=A0A518B7Y7_9BACT|nr:hypothetical protein Pan216_39610 [Planctomycetes bacterium Pan216]
MRHIMTRANEFGYRGILAACMSLLLLPSLAMAQQEDLYSQEGGNNAYSKGARRANPYAHRTRGSNPYNLRAADRNFVDKDQIETFVKQIAGFGDKTIAESELELIVEEFQNTYGVTVPNRDVLVTSKLSGKSLVNALTKAVNDTVGGEPLQSEFRVRDFGNKAFDASKYIDVAERDKFSFEPGPNNGRDFFIIRNTKTGMIETTVKTDSLRQLLPGLQRGVPQYGPGRPAQLATGGVQLPGNRRGANPWQLDKYHSSGALKNYGTSKNGTNRYSRSYAGSQGGNPYSGTAGSTYGKSRAKYDSFANPNAGPRTGAYLGTGHLAPKGKGLTLDEVLRDIEEQESEFYSNGSPRVDDKGREVYPNGSPKFSTTGVPLYSNGRPRVDAVGNRLHSNGRRMFADSGQPLYANGSARAANSGAALFRDGRKKLSGGGVAPVGTDVDANASLPVNADGELVVGSGTKNFSGARALYDNGQARIDQEGAKLHPNATKRYSGDGIGNTKNAAGFVERLYKNGESEYTRSGKRLFSDGGRRSDDQDQFLYRNGQRMVNQLGGKALSPTGDAIAATYGNQGRPQGFYRLYDVVTATIVRAEDANTLVVKPRGSTSEVTWDVGNASVIREAGSKRILGSIDQLRPRYTITAVVQANVQFVDGDEVDRNNLRALSIFSNNSRVGLKEVPDGPHLFTWVEEGRLSNLTRQVLSLGEDQTFSLQGAVVQHRRRGGMWPSSAGTLRGNRNLEVIVQQRRFYKDGKVVREEPAKAIAVIY